VAAELRELPDIEVVIAPGGFGELRVDVGGKDVYQSNRFWYPRSSKIAKIVREQLGQRVFFCSRQSLTIVASNRQRGCYATV
jgi:hypothetical protein